MTERMTLAELARKLQGLRDRKEALEAELKGVQKEIDQIAITDLPKMMEDMDEGKFTVPGLGTVFLTTKVYANVKAENRDQLFAWLRENGNGAMVKDWVFPQTLSSFAKEQLEKGVALPEFLTAALIPTATIRRSK